MHKKSNYDIISNGSSQNSDEESDGLLEDNNDNVSGNLIKVTKVNKNFQMKLKQRHEKVLMKKRQKTNASKISKLTIKNKSN